MTNDELFERARRVIPGGVNSPVRAFRAVGGTPRFIVRGDGPYIFDAEGKRYIDYIGSWGPMILGHRHPAVQAAVHAAVEEGLSFGAPTEREIELVEAILDARAEHGAGAPGQLGHRGGDERAPAGARRDRPQRHRQVRGLLPRPRRRAARQGRVGPRDLRPSDQRRRSRGRRPAHARPRIQQRRRARRGVRAPRQDDRLRDDRADRRQHELRSRDACPSCSACASCAPRTAPCSSSTR